MSNIKALRQRAHEQKKLLRGLLDGAAAENRDLNEAEATKYEDGLKALVATEKSKEREALIKQADELGKQRREVEQQHKQECQFGAGPKQVK